MESVFLCGYKDFEKRYNISKRTLQRWDKILKLPWIKMGDSKGAPVKMHCKVADEYVKILRRFR